MNQLSAQFDFHGEALKLRGERQRVLASNIANADTPNFQARDVNFKSALALATRGMPGSSSSSFTGGGLGSLTTTAKGHVSVPTFSLGNAKAPMTLQYREPAQGAMDANTVDMDVERANFADNSLRYEASLRFLNGRIKTMNLAVTGQ